jgi:dienelactone hydrolase
LAGESAVRRRRVRWFELLLTVLLFGVVVSCALNWSDLAASPHLNVQYVSFPSSDGVVISGALFSPAGASGRAPGVVVVHGLTDHKEYLDRVSVELARRNFVVLAIDLRDHGMSNGSCTFGLPGAEPQDVLNALQFLRARPEVDPGSLALVGHSFGGMVALLAASTAAGQVNATVTWAAPTNLTSLAADNYATVAFVVDKRVLPADLTTPEGLAVRSPIEYIAGLRPNSTLFLHSTDDTLVPVSQSYEAYNLTQARGQRFEEVQGAGHAMRTGEVLDKTIAFIELKTKGHTSDPLDPVYTSLERDQSVLLLLLTMMAWPVAWLSWEFWCSKAAQTVKVYNYPGDRVRWKAIAFFGADVGAFALALAGVGALVVPGSQGPPFAGTLPAPSLFAGMLAAGALLVAGAYGLSRAERSLRGRDDKRFEEGESLGRSFATVVPVLFLLPITIILQYLLFMGANYPRSAAFLLPLGVLLLAMLGFESFLRLRIQRRLRGLMGVVFTKPSLAAAVANILVGSLLYFVMLAWVMVWLFKGYAEVPGDTVLLTLAFGVSSSILYDRTKNILPGAVLSAVFLTWVLNGPFHF